MLPGGRVLAVLSRGAKLFLRFGYVFDFTTAAVLRLRV